MTAKKNPATAKPPAADDAAADKAADEKAAAEKAAAEKEAAEKEAAEKEAAKKSVEDKAKIVTVPALRVVAAREGFRRAGRAWSKEATVVALSELSEEQIEQIKNEAVLTVTEVEIPAQEAAE